MFTKKSSLGDSIFSKIESPKLDFTKNGVWQNHFLLNIEFEEQVLLKKRVFHYRFLQKSCFPNSVHANVAKILQKSV